MNNTRRKAIDKALAMIADLEADLNELANEIEPIKDEEIEAFENMPEGLQQSERGEMTEAAANALDNAHSEVESMVDTLSEIRDYLEEAQS